MNNKTIKRFDITIKLRGDNVYDIYLGKEWYCSHGNYLAAAEEIKRLMETVFLNEEI